MTHGDPDYDERLASAWADLNRLVRRLQTLSESAWRTRREAVVTLLAELAGIAGVLEGIETPRVPELASFALSDAVAVIAGDVLESLGSEARPVVLEEVLGRFRATLSATT